MQSTKVLMDFHILLSNYPSSTTSKGIPHFFIACTPYWWVCIQNRRVWDDAHGRTRPRVQIHISITAWYGRVGRLNFSCGDFLSSNLKDGIRLLCWSWRVSRPMAAGVVFGGVWQNSLRVNEDGHIIDFFSRSDRRCPFQITVYLVAGFYKADKYAFPVELPAIGNG